MFWHLVNVRFPLQDTLTAAGPLPCSTRSREPLTTMLRSSFWSVSTTTREQSGTAAPSSTLSRVQHGTVPFAKRHVDLVFSQLLVLLTEITQYPLAHSLSLAKDVLQHRRNPKSRLVASISLLYWLLAVPIFAGLDHWTGLDWTDLVFLVSAASTTATNYNNALHGVLHEQLCKLQGGWLEKARRCRIYVVIIGHHE